MNQTYSIFIGRKQIASGLDVYEAEKLVKHFSNNGDTAAHAAVTRHRHIEFNSDVMSLRMPKQILLDSFFDFAGQGEDESVWFMDAFGTKGSRHVFGYFVPIKMKEYDLFLGKEYGYTDRARKYVNLLCEHADTAFGMKFNRIRQPSSNERQDSAESLAIGFLRTNDDTKEYLGLFKHYFAMKEAVLMAEATGHKIVIDLTFKRILKEG